MTEQALTDTFAARKPVDNPALQRRLGQKMSQKRPPAQAASMGMPPLKRVAASLPPAAKSRLHRETSNHSNLDSLLEDISLSQQHKENRAPTSFAGLHKLVHGGGNAPFARREQKAPAKQLTTFNELSTLAAVKEEAQPDATSAANMLKGVLSQQHFALPPDSQIPTTSGGSQRSGPTASPPAVTPAAAPVSDMLPYAERPPVDWALRTRMRFASSEPLRLCEDATLASGRWVDSASAGHPSASLEEQYQQALQTYVHPAVPLEQNLVAALHGVKGGREMLAARRAAWDAAFTSLFQQLRNGATDAFYCVSPQDTRKTAFVALFRTAGLGGCGEPHALVSRSSVGLRALLRSETVPFSMPLAPAGAAEEEAATAALLADVEASNLGKAVTRDLFAAVDGSPQSLLTIGGATHVAGLAEVLCNHGARLFEGTCDVPQLLAPTAFAGAHLTRLQPQVKVSSLAAKAAVAGAARQQIGAFGYVAQLDGLIPPWVADRLCVVLAEAQGAGGLRGRAEPLALAACLNEPPPLPEDCGDDGMDTELEAAGSAGDGRWRGAGFTCAEEAARWREATPGLCGGTCVGEFEAADGRFRAKLRQARMAAPQAARNLSGWQ